MALNLNLQRIIETETELNTKIPFRAERPFLIEQLKPVQMDEEWWLQDRENKLMRLKKDYKRLWSLLSVSGGNPSDMAVIGKEDRYEPVGIWQQDEYLVL